MFLGDSIYSLVQTLALAFVIYREVHRVTDKQQYDACSSTTG